MAVGFAKTQDSIDHCLKLYQCYGNRARKLRAMGSAALDLAYVAAGRLDAYIEQGVNLWGHRRGLDFSGGSRRRDGSHAQSRRRLSRLRGQRPD